MIEKMTYVTIAGPKDEFDQVTENYLSDYEIHLENAVLELDSEKHIIPFVEENPYKELILKANEISENDTGRIDLQSAPKAVAKKEAKRRKELLNKSIGREEACALIINLHEALADSRAKRAELVEKKGQLDSDLRLISNFVGLNYNLEDVLKFKYVTPRFGHIAKDSWEYFSNNIDTDTSNFFTKCQTDSEYVWGAYFVPNHEAPRADSIFTSLRFERVKIPTQYAGTPKEICESLKAQIAEVDSELEKISAADNQLLDEKRDELFLAEEKLNELSHNFDARKMAGCISGKTLLNNTDTSFFLICGWMRTKDAKELDARFQNENNDIVCILDTDPVASGKNPPTSIKNRGIFKPYEMYTKMYGLPSYNEFDPTKILAILYSFIFGAMFGDLGHGLVLLVFGILIYFVKKSQLAGIVAFAGFFSCIFGLLYGSFFGFEDVIPTLWLKPREAMSNLNFVGRLNTVFAIAVAFGMFLTLALMIINVLSHIKQKNFVGSIFTSNGIAGFIFYGTIVLTVMLYMNGKALPATIVLLIFIIVPLLMMALNEPLTNLIKKRKALETGVGMFCLEAFFDLFETCLTFFSNTLSYVRVGAFAVSHAAMMEVVLSLGGYTEGGSGSIIVLIIGNIFVIGFEGLIVGIQVLRLQYYEIFSKFYIGEGREFKPFFKLRRNK